MTCLNSVLYNWNNNGVSDCKSNDWLCKVAYQWTINSDAYSQNSSSVFSVYSAGYVSSNDASTANATRPSIYLKSNVKVDGGVGTESLPYHLKA